MTWAQTHRGVTFRGQGDPILHLANPDGVIRTDQRRRLDAINDYYDNRVRAASGDVGSYRPLPPELLYLSAQEIETRFAEAPAHLLTPFHQPDSAHIVDFGINAGRDFAQNARKRPMFMPPLQRISATCLLRVKSQLSRATQSAHAIG